MWRRSHCLMAYTFTNSELTGRSRGHIVDLPDPPCSLHRDVVEPFFSMRAAAAREGIDLVPFSSFRDFDRQLAIWNGKARGERELLGPRGERLDARSLGQEQRVTAILTWSALPGASRHHWGTDFDVLDAAAMPPGYRPRLVPEEYAPEGIFGRLGQWLEANAARFGFFRPYSTWRGGVQPEPWHLSHAAVAAAAQAQFSAAVLGEAIEDAPIEDRAAVQNLLPQILRQYVLNVDAPPAAALELNAAGGSRLA